MLKQSRAKPCDIYHIDLTLQQQLLQFAFYVNIVYCYCTMQCWTHFSRQYKVIKVFCIHIDYPKFDPYPFIPQKSSSFSFSLALKTSPVAVTISAKNQHQRWFYEEKKVTLFLKFNCLYQAVLKDYCMIWYFLSLCWQAESYCNNDNSFEY